MKKYDQAGFTLVELMVVIAIIGIVSTIAIPSFKGMIISTRMSSQANEFLTTLQYARSEAVKRNNRVTMCKSANGTSCVTTGNWQQGWIVFANIANDGKVDSGDTLLKVHPALTGDSTLAGSTDFVSYGANGQAQAATFALCSNDATNFAGRDISLTLAGRPTVARDDAPCT